MAVESLPDPAAAPSAAGRIRLAARAISVRLRFPLIVGLAVLVVAQWDTLRAYRDRIIHGVRGVDLASQVVSGDTEYFCPMDPGVLSDWPSKCPICNMTLVRRKRGEATPLPDGVVARMQFSPYRVQLAGIRTTPAEYRPLLHSIEAPARLDMTDPAMIHLIAEVFPGELEGLIEGLSARARFGDSPEKVGKIVSISDRDTQTPTVVVELPPDSRPSDETARLTIDVPLDQLEPFRSQPAEPPPPRPGERRRVYECPEHPGALAEKPGKCPKDRRVLQRRDLAENQRIRYWCPMHPSVTAEEPGAECAECGGMRLVPRVITYRPRGEVLAIPADSVLDTGMRQVAYVERMPGMFEGVLLTLGPRCGDWYPVVAGIEPGDRVVAAGAFLVDAEGRLNPSLAVNYFGAGRRAEAVTDAAPENPLSPADRLFVAQQKTCPVTGKKLGSMGTPVRAELDGRTVFLCCEGCLPMIEENPAKYLAKLPAAAPSKPAP